MPYKGIQRDRIYILALLYELLIIGPVYNDSTTPIYLNAVRVLKTINLLPTTGFYLKSSPLSSNYSIKLLYIARAISIYSTAGLL